MVGCLDCWFNGWLFGRLVVWTVGCLGGWLFGWLVGCLDDWLFEWLIWLISWFICRLTVNIGGLLVNSLDVKSQRH